MMRSLYSGVSGLKVHQTKIDVIGNNISNVNTSGFKASRVTFNEIFSQTLSGASAPNAESGRAGTNAMQVGLGVNVSSIDMNMTEGAAQRTDISTDLKIEGEGFFVVGDNSGKYFTRAGAFRLDKNGTLSDSNGYAVQGWPANAEQDGIVKGQVEDMQIKNARNMYAEPEATNLIHFEGNLYTGDADETNESIVKNIMFYDSLGNSYSLDMTFKYVGNQGTGTTENKWDVTIGNTMYMNGDMKNPLTVSFTNNNPFQITFDENGKIVTDTTGVSQVVLTGLNDTTGLPVNSVFNDITIDFTDLTQFNQTTSAQAYTDNGCEPGSLESYSIGEDGIITGKYSNGKQKIFGQLVIATFKNPAVLEKIGINLYQTTTKSVDFDGIGQDHTTGGGGLNQGVLEMSNVDLSSEFTDMITTQRGFQANSKIITVSDEMLQTLVNMK